jgi:hypothetical protein
MVEHDQGLSRCAYEAGLECLGFGPGLTVLTGLPPPTPSAIAFKMSTSTTILLPTCPGQEVHSACRD